VAGNQFKEEKTMRVVDFSVTCLRVSKLVIDWQPIASSMQKGWRLDRLPEISVSTAEPGLETDAHIARVDAVLSRELAGPLDSPWGIDGLAEPVMHALREKLRVHEVVFDYKILDVVK